MGAAFLRTALWVVPMWESRAWCFLQNFHRYAQVFNWEEDKQYILY